ncbi:MAG: DUF1934 domain-containing protein [Sporomusa sp.]
MSLIKALNSNADIAHVLITVTGCQQDVHGEENTIELFTHGRSYAKNGVHYISYQETEVSGMEGSATLLKIYADHCVLVRTGKVRQRQKFRRGERSVSSYVTPYGALEMGVRTTGLTVSRAGQDNLVTGVAIEYELEIDGQWQSANKLTVIIQGDKNGY